MDLKRAGESIRTMWSGLSAGQRAAVALLVVALAGAVAWGMSAAGGAERKLVGSETSVEQQAEILQRLKELGFPYRVRDGAIYVPADRADEAFVRIHGVSPEASAGWLESPADAKQRQKLAKEARLARSAQSIAGVRTVRVHITQPETSGFGRGVEGSAAVVVGLKEGTVMTGAIVQSLAQIVASGAGLKPEQVKVIGPDGVHTVGDPESVDAGTLHGLARKIGKEYAADIEKMLPPESRVVVNVKLNPTRRHERIETPGKPVVLEEKGTELKYKVPDNMRDELTKEGAEITSVSAAVIIPERPPVPTAPADRTDFVNRMMGVVRVATGIKNDSDIVVTTLPAVAVAAPAAPTMWEEAGDWAARSWGQVLLVGLALVIALGLWRVARASLDRTPAVTVEESAAAAMPADADAARLRAGVTEAALRDPREAAGLVRRLMER